jgi:hypothetical protein
MKQKERDQTFFMMVFGSFRGFSSFGHTENNCNRGTDTERKQKQIQRNLSL